MKDSNKFSQYDGSEIAIIGMTGRFPDAQNTEQFWENLREGKESVTFFADEKLLASGVDPDALNDARYVKARSILSDIEMFDPTFFGFSPREAECMDPQHRLLLECVWEAIEIAGYDAESFKGAISLYAGASINSYLLNNLYANPEAMDLAGDFQVSIFNNPASLATGIAYKLNLKGPCYTILTFCSTSLVSIHAACQSLLNYESDMAIAGGVSIFIPQHVGYWYQEGLIVSPDGHCRPFDAKARGTVFGNGLGVVVLRRLEDALADGDSIDAIILGSALNNDGAVKVSYTAPSVSGQAEVVVEALANAGVDPDSIAYIETHGTATELGDSVEVAALTQAFRAGTQRKGYCAIGSLKSNIGHLDAAAGVTGLIKTVLALKHKEIPPSLHFEAPNPDIDFANSPFFVNSQLREWKTDGIPRRAGVSSFGVGGTNAHVILQEAPELEPSKIPMPYQLLILSARTPSALETMTFNLAKYLKEHLELNLADVAFTLQVGRKAFGYRRMIVCRDCSEAVSMLQEADPRIMPTVYQERRDPSVAFMFTGQGSQYVNMGLELYRNEVEFKRQIDHCSEILKLHLASDLRSVVYPAKESTAEATQKLRNTIITQPALFTIEYALAKLWMSWGVQPGFFIGHSIGEYVAACLAGVFSLEDALALVATRGKLMQDLPGGSMLAVMLSQKEIEPFLGTELSLAAINGPSFCVVSGGKEAIKNLETELTKNNVDCRQLHTSHGFHSKMMEPILSEFIKQAEQINFKEPQIPITSTVTGSWVKPEEIMDPEYWAKNLRQTVRFDDALRVLLKESNGVFLEVGPGQTLSILARQHPHRSKAHDVLFSLRHPQEQKSDYNTILNTLGRLWLAGIQIDWSGFYRGQKRRRIPLPTYPFEKQRCWIDPAEPPRGFLASRVGLIHKVDDALYSQFSNLPEPDFSPETSEVPATDGVHLEPLNETEQILAGIWQKILGVKKIGIHDNYFEIGGNSINAARLFAQIAKIFNKKIPMGTLLEAPTLKELADVLVSENAGSYLSSMVKIQNGGQRPAFFCVHSASGQALEYRRLAHHLGEEQPFYALQTKTLNGDGAESYAVESMASRYLKEVREVQPKGPFYLGGYCLGGLIAFEMAQQLLREGEEIAFLAMISSSTPDHLRNTLPHLGTVHTQFYRLIERIELEFSNIAPLDLNQKKTYIFERIRRALSLIMIRTEKLLGPLYSKLQSNNSWHSFAYNLQTLADKMDQAHMQYEPRFYPGHLTLFRVSNQPRRLHFEPYLGWKSHAKTIKVHEVYGYHKNILREPYVRGLAEQLRRCIKTEEQSRS